MRWKPYVVGTRMSIDVRTDGALARAKELIEMRGPLVDREEKDQLEFRTPILGFFFYGPFALVTRTIVRTEQLNGSTRVVYDLKHPFDLLITVLLVLLAFSENMHVSMGVVLLLYPILHSAILFFMHREIVRGIAGDPDRGEKLVRTART